jgi:hypothetical protein
MDGKAAWLLIGLVGFALWCATPAVAENDQVQFYNSLQTYHLRGVEPQTAS